MSDIMSKKEKKQRQEDFERFVALWREYIAPNRDRLMVFELCLIEFGIKYNKAFYLPYDLFIVKYDMILNGDIPQSK